mgnify:CR=1 FL=1
MDAPDLLPRAGAPLPARPNPEATPNADLQRVAQEFEAVFLSEMLAPMFESLDTEGLGGGGMGEQMFRPMLVQRYAETIARAGGVGIADSILREFTRMQTVVMPEDEDGAPR